MVGKIGVPKLKRRDYKKQGLRYIGGNHQLLRVPIVFSIIINAFLPGIGVIMTGKPGSGYFQFLLFSLLLYAFLTADAFVRYVAVVLFVPLWIWSLTSVIWMPLERI